MTNPISAKLRDTAQGIANNLGGITHDGFDVSDQCREAADHIDAQAAKIKALVDALERIADLQIVFASDIAVVALRSHRAAAKEPKP